MARRSAADLAVVPVGLAVVERLKPPRSLTKRQQAHFLNVVSAVSADRFTRLDLPLLVQLARHLDAADAAAALIDAAEDAVELKDALDIQRKESAAIQSLATRLRITQQARYVPHDSKLRKREAGGIDALLSNIGGDE